MPINTLNHFTILTEDIDKAVTFFKDALGFTEGYTPEVEFPLVWLYSGEHPTVHIVERDSAGSLGSGRIDHIAFKCSDYATVKARLDTCNAAQKEQSQPDIGVHQIFVETPDGVWLELVFDYKEYKNNKKTIPDTD